MRTHNNLGRHLTSLTAQEKLDFHRAKNQVLILEQRVVEKRLLAEATAELLLEALTEDELVEVKQNIVPKLKALDAATSSMPYLNKSVASAAADVGKFAKKGFFSKLASGGISAISNFLGIKTAENPLLKTMTYLTSLENFFGKITELVKRLKKGDEMKQADKIFGEIFDDEEKATLQKSLIDSMTPEGIFSKIASVFGEGIPYLPGGGAKKLVNELLSSATVGDVTNIVKALQSGKKTSDLASTAQEITAAASDGAGAGGSAGGGAKSSGGPEQVLSSPVQLAGAIQAQAASQAGKPPPSPEKVKAQASETTKKFLASVLDNAKKKDPDVTDKDVSNVVKVLLNRKKFASEFGIKVESRKMARNNLVALSPRDVLVARQLFIESGGSSRRWVKLLLERNIGEKEIEAFKELLKSVEKGDISSVEDLKGELPYFVLTKAMKKQLINALKEKNPKIDVKQASSELEDLQTQLQGEKTKAEEFRTELGERQKKSLELVQKLMANEAAFDKLARALKLDPKNFDDQNKLLAALQDRAQRSPEELEQAFKQIGIKDEQISKLQQELESEKSKAEEFRKELGNRQVRSLEMTKELQRLSQQITGNDEKFRNLADALGIDKNTDINEFFKELQAKAEETPKELKKALENIGIKEADIQKIQSDLSSTKEQLQQQTTLAAELAASLRKNYSALDAVAKLMNLSDDDKKDPDKILAAVKKMIDEKPAAAAKVGDAVGVPVNAEESGKPAGSKSERLAGEIQKGSSLLKDMPPTRIVAILDAIPEFLLGESLRQRNAMLGRRLLSNRV